MKIKHPIPFWIIVALNIAMWVFIFTNNNPDSLFTDYSFRRSITDIVFFVSAGIIMFCLEADNPKDSASLKVAALVCFALAAFNTFYLFMHNSGAFLPAGPAPELDDFGNPMMPTVDGIEDLIDYIEP